MLLSYFTNLEISPEIFVDFREARLPFGRPKTRVRSLLNFDPKKSRYTKITSQAKYGGKKSVHHYKLRDLIFSHQENV